MNRYLNSFNRFIDEIPAVTYIALSIKPFVVADWEKGMRKKSSLTLWLLHETSNVIAVCVISRRENGVISAMRPISVGYSLTIRR